MTKTTLHSTISGRSDGPALLLLNSFGATKEMWDNQLPMFEAYYRVIRCDTRGHGGSPTPAGPYSFDNFIEDVLAVLDEHGVETVDVIGLSMGGMTALGLGLAVPERINRIVCCAARSDAPEPFVQNWHNRLGMLDDGGIEAVWNGTVGMWLSDETRANRPEQEAALRNSFLKTTDEGYRGCAQALMGLDYLRHLGDMIVPTLFVAGEGDMAAPPAVMKVMADACPNSEYAVVSGAKHIINVDNPDDFAVSIFGFLGLDG
ncbi:alpha/beta fold hydrolase [Octadecabacter sp. CECT 8868]|uniref:alpha/beta fold hydrolase n=1 Tax=Octadecabacter algicola TaxID=2909342 RepID=UPI001F2F5945|nr:alpha/beta fold hydrolase [Octadecabacter algicola]MCF2905578.1 alpha/beta fold hydrolase [Octadecabacter algicola]